MLIFAGPQWFNLLSALSYSRTNLNHCWVCPDICAKRVRSERDSGGGNVRYIMELHHTKNFNSTAWSLLIFLPVFPVFHSTWSTSTSTVLLLSTTFPSTTVSTTVMTFVTTEERKEATIMSKPQTYLRMFILMIKKRVICNAYLVLSWWWREKERKS